MGGLTAAQLVTLACQAARGPGYTSQAGQMLNSILSDLCQMCDLEVAAKTVYGEFNPGQTALVGNSLYGSGPYALPPDFLRWKDDKSFFWTLPGTGVTYPEIMCDLSEFDLMVQQAGTQSYPYLVATDMSISDQVQQGLPDGTTASFYVYSPPSGAYPYQGRYYSQMADIPTPETSSVVPWFPNQGYLRKKLSAAVAELTGDDRAAQWDGEANAILAPYLKLKDNKSNRAQTVKMDRRWFGNSYVRLPNTKAVGW